MNTFLGAPEFDEWLSKLRDQIAKARIIARIRSDEAGGSPRCGFTSEPDTGRIFVVAERSSTFSFAAATNPHRSVTSARQSEYLRNWRVKMNQIKPFEAADYLDNDEVIAEYLNAALEDPNPDVFLMAISDVAKARGMSKLAKDAGLGRESLYKALTPGAKPRYETVIKLVRALGVELNASPAKE